MYEFDAKKAAEDCVGWIKGWFDENGKGCNAIIGISGGKDSTVVAALCKEALGADHVIGIMMPNGIQSDINDSKRIIRHLDIRAMELNIGMAMTAMKYIAMEAMEDCISQKPALSRQAEENLPPRIRMAALYMISQTLNGRVSNNCNLSENWIGYSTIYGDAAGDFAPLANFTVSEVIEVGRALGVPEEFLIKPPADGLCGKTDEEKIGFQYAVLDEYIRTGVIYDIAVKNRIDEMHEKNRFKHEPIAAFKCSQFN